MWKYKGPRIAKTILKRGTVGELTVQGSLNSFSKQDCVVEAEG